ncbi:MAG: TolC family protein [Kiritimatiellae bacterium]|nr:TolC family protein [Kiritimatiellia bacterium]
MKTTKTVLLVSSAVALAGCATVQRARDAQETDLERTVAWAETPFAARGADDPVAMEELAGWARTNAPAVVQARQDVVAAQIALRSVNAAYIPVVDGAVAYTYASQNIDPHDTDWDGDGTWGGNLSLNWLLCDFGRTRASTRRAVAALAAADMAERAAENQAAYGVRSACFSLGRARELLEVAHATSESYREHRDQTKDRRDVGAAMDYEVSKAEVDYQNALLSEISAANAVETARASLCLALGLAENPDIALGDCSFPEIPGTAAELMEIARTNAPALAALKASADAAKDYVDWTICDLYPKLSFSLTFDAKGDSSPLLWNYAAVPAAAQNLFSAGAKTRQIEAAVAQLRAARSKLAQAEQETWNAIVLATLAADRARKSLSVAETALDAAKENFEVVANRYEVGKASALERTDAQVALSAAEASVVTARCDLQDTQILLARIVGL